MQLMKCLFGSHLYGLDTPASDRDYKGIYLPDRDSLLLGNYARHYSQSTGDDKTKNTKDDVDVEIFSLPYFIELACKGETVAIDMLHADLRHYQSQPHEIWQELKADRHLFYTKDMKSYVGYARRQASKYGIKGSRIAAIDAVRQTLQFVIGVETLRDNWSILPISDHLRKDVMNDKSSVKPLYFYEVCGRKYQDTLTVNQLMDHMNRMYDEYGERAQLAKDNGGIDWKAVSHSLRASYQMLGILRDGDFEYPLPQTQFLLDVKRGKLDFVTQVQPELEQAIEEIEALAAVSNLPSKVNRNYWDRKLLEWYGKYF